MFDKKLLAQFVIAAAASTAISVSAQIPDFGHYRAQSLDAEMHGLGPVRVAQRFRIAGPTTAANTMDSDQPWPTKAALLAVGASGEAFRAMSTIKRSDDARLEPWINSVSVILGSEYGVPPLPARPYCAQTYATDVLVMLQVRTLAEGYRLAPDTPTYNPAATFRGNLDHLPSEQLKLMAQPGPCDEPGGFLRPGVRHPYKAALASLMDEYADAVQGWAKAETQRLTEAKNDVARAQQEAYQREREAGQRRAQDREAAEKRQFEAERARIASQEARQQQKQGARP